MPDQRGRAVALGVGIEGFGDTLQAGLFRESGLHRYWAPGHGSHYTEALAFDAQGLDALRDTIADLSAS